MNNRVSSSRFSDPIDYLISDDEDESIDRDFSPRSRKGGFVGEFPLPKKSRPNEDGGKDSPPSSELVDSPPSGKLADVTTPTRVSRKERAVLMKKLGDSRDWNVVALNQ